MALVNGLRMIWLDQHIGEDGNCEDLKKMFRETMKPVAAMPPTAVQPIPPSSDAIDALICALSTNAAPIDFVHLPELALNLIEHHHDKQIIFISSASLGKDLISKIVSNYTHVYSFYIFCGQMHYAVDWALDYIHCLKMFDFGLDLLLRLARDVSVEIIKQGNIYMGLDDPTNALKCFEHSRTIEEECNTRDTLNPPFLKHLIMLNGDNNNIGLIQQARDKIRKKQQEEQRNRRTSS